MTMLPPMKLYPVIFPISHRPPSTFNGAGVLSDLDTLYPSPHAHHQLCSLPPQQHGAGSLAICHMAAGVTQPQYHLQFLLCILKRLRAVDE